MGNRWNSEGGLIMGENKDLMISEKQLEILEYFHWSLLGLVDEIERLREKIKEMEDYY
jgi:hypothetical protein